ncbi:hypothetical protein GGTG_02754 [Gaeumannomyces tritici R3-111a-1]|uniref:Uncharacterized protein n=1 Tax=Gaeumannomyces tritici (strain R3-111a-1) TaxID=644352 RepID=J3NN98_GAET3|nr:hypothetical protein GGTG_02754 [Gaeumannomyces tritici R3-111a-1]EJT77650.1 hypothetical protein GGTG_02754 [Gaeumannomyces tritici R3-111a-1]
MPWCICFAREMRVAMCNMPAAIEQAGALRLGDMLDDRPFISSFSNSRPSARIGRVSARLQTSAPSDASVAGSRPITRCVFFFRLICFVPNYSWGHVNFVWALFCCCHVQASTKQGGTERNPGPPRESFAAWCHVLAD